MVHVIYYTNVGTTYSKYLVSNFPQIGSLNFPQLPLPDLHLGEGVPGHLHHERGEREALLVLRRGRELGDHPAAQIQPDA